MTVKSEKTTKLNKPKRKKPVIKIPAPGDNKPDLGRKTTKVIKPSLPIKPQA